MNKKEKLKIDMHVRLLNSEDIYDFYGCAYIHGLFKTGTVVEELPVIHNRIREVHKLYIDAAKARIRSEAKFCGVDMEEDFTMARMMRELNKLIESELEQSAESLMRGGKFNLLKTVVKGHQMAGADLKGIDLQKFGLAPVKEEKKKDELSVTDEWFKKGNKNSRLWDNPRWAEIAKTYLKMEEAGSIDEVIEVVDYLNNLQHNSFHLLIDLQTGRMLDNHGINHDEAVRVLKDVLQVKADAKHPIEFADKMGNEISSIVRRYISGNVG